MRAPQHSIYAYFAIVLVVCLTSFHTQARGRHDDLWKFDIGDVKLHMSGKEVIEALKKKFGSSLNVVQVDTIQLAPKDVIAYSVFKSRLVPGKSYINGIAYSVSGQHDYSIVLSERLPGEDDTRPETVVRVMLQPRNISTREDMYQFDKAVLDKYGTPTWDDNSTGYFSRKIIWCYAKMSFGSCDSPSQPYLEWSRHFPDSFFLDLGDTDYFDKVNAAYDRIIKAPKPPL